MTKGFESADAHYTGRREQFCQVVSIKHFVTDGQLSPSSRTTVQVLSLRSLILLEDLELS